MEKLKKDYVDYYNVSNANLKLSSGDISSLFNQVFDREGNIRLCGRDICMSLILSCYKLDRYTDYGNPNNGMMNVTNIKRLY